MAPTSATARGTVRAARIHAFGDPTQLRIEDIPAPEPAPGEVLVRVSAAGLNPLDYKMRDGSSPKARMLTLPAVLGREMTGTVIGAGEGTDLDALGMPVGTAVFGVRALDDPRGTYAQVIAMPADLLAPVPEEVAADGDRALAMGGLALVGATAIAAIADARIREGDTVLVHGGTGGVGQLLIPLAREAGAGRIWATGRAANAERIRALGAVPIAYDEVDWQAAIDEATQGRGVDVVLDTHYFSTFEPSLEHLAPGGRIIELPTLADLGPARERGIDARIPALTSNREILDRLATGFASGALGIEVAEVLPLADVARGHELLETGHTRGKLLLDLR